MTKITNKTYLNLINNLKYEIKTARVKAHLAVNQELILLYFKIGRLILEKQRKEKWGSKIIEKVSNDLKKEFSDMKGLSSRNIRYMKKFAEIYENEIVQQPVAQLKNQKQFVPQTVGQLRKLPFFNIISNF